MNIAQKREKMKRISEKSDDIPIFVTHLNIRQSIFFLLIKLLMVDIFFAICIILFNSFFFSSLGQHISFRVGILLFIFLVCIKILIMAYVIFEWLEEYYEIYPKEVIHKKGIIFKKEQRYILKHIGSVVLLQGVWGKMFNFGTIKLYDWVLGREAYLYLIHNPIKYHTVIKTLLTDVDKEKEIFREHIVESEDIDDV